MDTAKLDQPRKYGVSLYIKRSLKPRLYAQFAPWCKFTPGCKIAPWSKFATPYVAFMSINCVYMLLDLLFK